MDNSISSLEGPQMDRGKEQTKQASNLISPDLPMILKLGRLRLALLSREGKCLRTLDPRNKDNN